MVSFKTIQFSFILAATFLTAGTVQTISFLMGKKTNKKVAH